MDEMDHDTGCDKMWFAVNHVDGDTVMSSDDDDTECIRIKWSICHLCMITHCEHNS